MYETYAGYTKYAKHACLNFKSCYQRYECNKAQQIKQISPIWDDMGRYDVLIPDVTLLLIYVRILDFNDCIFLNQEKS